MAQNPEKEVAPEHIFHFQDGKQAHNLKDLRETISVIGMDAYRHHVDDTNNDFANWVEFVYKNPDLATDLRNVTDQKKTLEILDAELGRYGGEGITDDPVPEPEEPGEHQPPKQLHEDPYKPTVPPQSIEHEGEVLHTVSTEAVHHFITREFLMGAGAGLLLGLIITAVLIQLGVVAV